MQWVQILTRKIESKEVEGKTPLIFEYFLDKGNDNVIKSTEIS